MKKHRSHWLCASAVIGMLSLAGVAWGAPPQGHQSSKTRDVSTWFDGNSLLAFINNTGSFAYDKTLMLSPTGGLHYPRGSGNTLIYSGGIWVGAKSGGNLVVSVSEYSDDFAPGPMKGGTFQPDRPEFHTYKVSSGDSPVTDLDYLTWPFSDGAPSAKNYLGLDSIDASGNRVPLVIGNQSLWAVFNDTDPYYHSNLGSTDAGMGLEVQCYAFGFDDVGPLGQVVYLHHTLINKSGSWLEDMYVGLWADPDLGETYDDLGGSDPSAGLGYCYNQGADGVYGMAAPAVGYALMQGPIVPSPGDSAMLWADSRWVPEYRNLPLAAIDVYANGSDPESAIHTYNYLRGLASDGSDRIDPTTGLPTTFVYSGDPVTGTGWVDATGEDKRFMLTCGPFTMPPGATQEIVSAIVVGQGADHLSSITALRDATQIARSTFEGTFGLMHKTSPLLTDIDVQPGLCPNGVPLTEIAPPTQSLARRSVGDDRTLPDGGYLHVAIVGSENLDIANIDHSSLTLAGIAPLSIAPTDIVAQVVRETRCDCVPSVGDRRTDLVLELDPQSIYDAMGQPDAGIAVELVLKGRLLDGREIVGVDCAEFRLPLPPIKGVVISDEVPVAWKAPGISGHGLIGNYPNPFNAGTVIRYNLEQPSDVRLKVYNILGQNIATLVDTRQVPGPYEVAWDGINRSGRAVASGMYFYRLQLGDMGMFPVPEPVELAGQTMLSFDRNGDHRGWLSLAAAVENEIGAGAVAVIPGGPDQ